MGHVPRLLFFVTRNFRDEKLKIINRENINEIVRREPNEPKNRDLKNRIWKIVDRASTRFLLISQYGIIRASSAGH